MGGFLFIWLVSFWWWEFKFQDLDVEWSFGLYLFIVSYAMWLFVLAVVLVPDDMEGMRDSFEYFLDENYHVGEIAMLRKVIGLKPIG